MSEHAQNVYAVGKLLLSMLMITVTTGAPAGKRPYEGLELPGKLGMSKRKVKVIAHFFYNPI